MKNRKKRIFRFFFCAPDYISKVANTDYTPLDILFFYLVPVCRRLHFTLQTTQRRSLPDFTIQVKIWKKQQEAGDYTTASNVSQTTYSSSSRSRLPSTFPSSSRKVDYKRSSSRKEVPPRAADYFSKQRSSINCSLKVLSISSVFCQNFPKIPKFFLKTNPNSHKILIFSANYAIIIIEKGKERKQKL